MNKVKEQMANKNQVAKKAKPMLKEKQSKGMVFIPYVNGLTERIQRVYKKHKLKAAMKPHSTLRNILVHPKDKGTNSNIVMSSTRSGVKTATILMLEKPHVYSE